MSQQIETDNDIVIIHRGITAMASNVETHAGKTYPFAFHAITPVEKQWVYRILETKLPAQLGPEGVADLIKRHGPRVRAMREEVVGHPVGFVTFLVVENNGATKFSAKAEDAPELRPTIPERQPTITLF